MSTPTEENAEEISCPFCGENDFDLLGLKIHLMRGWCEQFEALNPKNTTQ